MSTSWQPAAVWANMPPPSYHVTIPEGRESLYEWVGPVFLALAVAAGGWWLVRGRSLRTGPRRALLWAAAGCLAVSYSAWWVWANRNDVVQRPGWGAWAAVVMPWLWLAAAVLVVWRGWPRVHRDPEPAVPEARGEGDAGRAGPDPATSSPLP